MALSGEHRNDRWEAILKTTAILTFPFLSRFPPLPLLLHKNNCTNKYITFSLFVGASRQVIRQDHKHGYLPLHRSTKQCYSSWLVSILTFTPCPHLSVSTLVVVVVIPFCLYLHFPPFFSPSLHNPLHQVNNHNPSADSDYTTATNGTHQ